MQKGIEVAALLNFVVERVGELEEKGFEGVGLQKGFKGPPKSLGLTAPLGGDNLVGQALVGL